MNHTLYPLRKMFSLCAVFFWAALLFPCPTAGAKSAPQPGEPLIRAFVEMFQAPHRDTRLEAYFLSIGLPNRPEHTRVLRQRLSGADELERVIILYALAAMTRDAKDIDAFLQAFPKKNRPFLALLGAEGSLTDNYNTGMADFLFMLVYEPRTREKAIPLLARISCNVNAGNEFMSSYLEDEFVKRYVDKYQDALYIKDEDYSIPKFKHTNFCDKKMQSLLKSNDVVSQATAILMNIVFKDFDLTKDAVKNFEKKKKPHEYDLIIKMSILQNNCMDYFPETQEQIVQVLQTEKSLYRFPLGGIAHRLLSSARSRIDPEEQLQKAIRNLLRYGRAYLEAYEEHHLTSFIQGE